MSLRCYAYSQPHNTDSTDAYNYLLTTPVYTRLVFPARAALIILCCLPIRSVPCKQPGISTSNLHVHLGQFNKLWSVITTSQICIPMYCTLRSTYCNLPQPSTQCDVDAVCVDIELYCQPTPTGLHPMSC